MRALTAAAVVLGAAAPAAEAVELKVLSNRADLISGGDALVEVVGAERGAVRISAGHRDVSDQFTVRDGRLVGLVTGLPEGPTELTARVRGAAGAAITIVNHPLTGPRRSAP